MRREDFEHVIRAAAAIVRDEIVVIGSQAVLAQYPNAPDALLTSLEVDVFPRNHPERADEIDGALGDGSPFHQTFGYYAHSVGRETPIAPAGWESRLVRIEVSASGAKGTPATAWCLEIHDLVLAKLAAGRTHDFEFVEGAIDAELVETERLQRGIELMPQSHRALTRERLNGLIRRLQRRVD